MNLNPDVEAGEGWANGTFRMDAKDIDAFYHANLYINVATTTNVRALRGRIVQNLLGLAQEFSRSPILLHGNPPNRTAIRYHSYNTLALLRRGCPKTRLFAYFYYICAYVHSKRGDQKVTIFGYFQNFIFD